ncbi:MAG TPA: phospho-N-acetylmuramoyl-pentapeptide-transferase [Clostridiales bacterium]|nr:phospho-N-acetylmuramoyl-pentapeptide-transferase [Clostridiales bacterium]
MKEFSITFAIGAAAVFALTVAAERVLIPILRSHKLGQKILDIGPRWHKSKEGTPIMGGLGFILAALVVMAVFFVVRGVQGRGAEYIPLALTLGLAVGNGAIGFVDDYCKLVKKQNEGLTWKQKLFLQLALATAYVVVMSYTGNLSTAVNLPFTEKTLELGWGFYPIAVIILAGVTNGGNITDGVDGLASGVTFVVGAFLAVCAFSLRDEQLGAVSAILVGATLGFLVYNFHPAKVFMGDTGSLFLGSLVIGCAFMMREPIVGLMVAAVYILEMLSSLLQVVWFRLTHGKRLFKMAPIHHHFEQCGWSENRIVLTFSLAEALFCVLAWFALH